MKDDRLKANIWKYNLFQALRYVVFFVPIIVLFWQENGLSLTEVMILQAFYSIAVVLLEIPTGYFADVKGRRFSLFLASICAFIGMVIYSVGTGFWIFLVAEIFLAFYVSLVSGANSALVYDTLKDLGREREYKKVWGNAVFIGMAVLSVANVLGGFIGKIDFRWTFYTMLPFTLLLIPVSWSLKEPTHHKMIFKKGYVHHILEIIKKTLIKNAKLRSLIFYAGITFGFYQSILWFYQPYFELSGLDVVYFGIVFALFQIVAGFSSRYAHKIEKVLGEKASLVVIPVIIGASYLLMSHFVFVFSFIFAFIQQFVRGYYKIIISDYTNKLVDSKIRATVLSVQSMFGQLAYAIIIPIIGVVADVYTLTRAIFVLGISSFVFGGVAVLLLRKSRVI